MSEQDLSYTGVSQGLYDRLRVKALAAGVVFDGQNATVGKIQFTWNYNPATATLYVVCVHKPFGVPFWLIKNKLDDIMDEAKKGYVVTA